MKIKSLKNKLNRGFTTIDIVVSVTIVMIFTAIITTLFYNFYLTTTARNRNAVATNCLIDVIEQVKMMSYADVSDSTVNSLVEKLTNNKTIPKGYTVTSNVTKYNSTTGNTSKKDVIKILNVTVSYLVGSREEKIEISTLITK
jgi:type II secretory pathway pseudopilin PulG